jgi:microcystin degradation protein MlrC
MRIAIGGIYHESNTFFAQPMTVEKFAEQALHFGPEILSYWNNTTSETAGFLRGIRNYGYAPFPTMMAWGWPSGALTAETFEKLGGELVSRLRDNGPFDGVLLSLHGAMVSEEFPDADAEILRRVREAIGANTPLVVTTDYHANFTEEMMKWPDAIVSFDTYPHVDQVERGMEAVEILVEMLTKGLRPKLALARRPFLPHILSQLTERRPIADAIAMAHRLEERPDIVSVSVAAGFPYTDVPDAGFSVVAVGRGDQQAATEAAETLAEYVWARRGPQEAVRQAVAESQGLTILVDVGDNLGAGTPGDGTVLLKELLAQGARDTLILLPDPESVAQCIAEGVRNRVRLKVGGKSDKFHGEPVEIEGAVRLVSDGIFRNIGPMRDGVLDDQGRTAVVDSGGVTVVLTEHRLPMWNLEQLRSIGIEPTRLRIIVVKAAVAYRAAYGPIASRIIEADTPGLSAADVRRFQYKHLKRPIFPLDPL